MNVNTSFLNFSLKDIYSFIFVVGLLFLISTQPSYSHSIEVKKVDTNSTLKVAITSSYQRSISGVITNEEGEPLQNVNIVVKNSTIGTTTDLRGNFFITIPDSNNVLVVSSIGYLTQEINIENRIRLNIIMEIDPTKLNEIVIVGYGSINKKELTGSVTSLEPRDFTQGVNYDAVQLLNGAAPGVYVSQVSSAPGAALKIQVRGAGSINSDNSVLFVVDGLPGIDPSSLSPEDIESIDILKDASSAAIYGARAANGVVLITTKKGNAGQSSISYRGYSGLQSVSKKIDVLGARDYADLVNFRQPNTYTPEQISEFGDGTKWQDEIFQSALVQNHQISMSGGNTKSNYYLGLNYFDQNGVVKSSSSKKYNVRLNLETRPLKDLLVAVNTNYTRQINNDILFSNRANERAGPINSAIQFDPTLSSGLDSNGRYFRNSSISLDNPIALIKGIDNGTVSNKLYGSINADYDISDQLIATVRVGGESNNSKLGFYRSRVTDEGLARGGVAKINSNDFTHWLFESLLKYSNNWSGKHNLSVMGGVTFEEFLNSSVSLEASGFVSDQIGLNLLQSGNLVDDVSSNKLKNQINSFIGRISYNYTDRFFLTGSFRFDGSSRFARNNKYAFFPSGSIAWNISEETFFKNNKIINGLKLRIGYGSVGNQGINNFETRETLVSNGSDTVIDGEIVEGVVLARLPNPNLKWETTTEINVGLDYGLWNNRLAGSIDFFNRKTSDQLLIKPLPSVLGFNSTRVNFGEVRNRGVDIAINSVNVTRQNFKWNTRLNISLLKNEVTKLPSFSKEIVGGTIGTFINQYTLVSEGEALQSFFGYEIDGIFQLDDDISNSATPNFSPGMPRFVDQDNDGDIDSDDRVVLGDPFPDFTFGFTNNFNFKNLYLDVFLQGVYGLETLDANVIESLYPSNSSRNSITRYYRDRWTPSNPSNSLPSGENPSLYGGARVINSLTVVDASFLRLKNITLGYNLPISDNWGLSSFGLYIGVDNIFTITNFEGYDPDASSEGLDTESGSRLGPSSVARASYNSYPLARTVRFGIDIKF